MSTAPGDPPHDANSATSVAEPAALEVPALEVAELHTAPETVASVVEVTAPESGPTPQPEVAEARQHNEQQAPEQPPAEGTEAVPTPVAERPTEQPEPAPQPEVATAPPETPTEANAAASSGARGTPSDKPAQPAQPPVPPASPTPVPQPPPGAKPTAVQTAGLVAAEALLNGPVLITAALLIGWFGWLSYTALTKSRDPIVSRAQAAVAPLPVVATVDADDKGVLKPDVIVEESLRPDGPPAKTPLVVENLAGARGFKEKGKYLLLLTADPPAFTADGRRIFRIVGSRGTGSDSDPATIYPWSPDVEAQARRAYRAKQ
jgi:hypothetical protein